jgi:hypothetical protein
VDELPDDRHGARASRLATSLLLGLLWYPTLFVLYGVVELHVRLAWTGLYAAITALQMVHSLPGLQGIRSRYWPGELHRAGAADLPATPVGAQVLLVYLPIPVFGMAWHGMASYLAAWLLVALRSPLSWLAFAVCTAVEPIIVIELTGSGAQPSNLCLDPRHRHDQRPARLRRLSSTR